MLNLAQAKELFQREAVLFGALDGVPITRVAELFGPEAAHSVIDRKTDRNNGPYWNLWEVRGHVLMFAYFCGFLYAASYANAVEIARKETVANIQSKVIDFPKREKHQVGVK